MTPSERIRTQLYLHPNVKRRLLAATDPAGRSMGHIVDDLVLRYLDKYLEEFNAGGRE